MGRLTSDPEIISIHVLRMEDDFLSPLFFVHYNISIHVLRMEDDYRLILPALNRLYFNPRPPHGGRHYSIVDSKIEEIFQSTSSAWRTTIICIINTVLITISIHVLRMEDDHTL